MTFKLTPHRGCVRVQHRGCAHGRCRSRPLPPGCGCSRAAGGAMRLGKDCSTDSSIAHDCHYRCCHRPLWSPKTAVPEEEVRQGEENWPRSLRQTQGRSQSSGGRLREEVREMEEVEGEEEGSSDKTKTKSSCIVPVDRFLRIKRGRSYSIRETTLSNDSSRSTHSVRRGSVYLTRWRNIDIF